MDLPAPQSAPPPPPPPRTLPGIYVLFAAVAFLVFGSLMPWLKVTAPFIGTITRSGVDNGGDGVFVIFVAAVIGVMALVAMHGSPKVRTATAVVGFLGAILITFILVIDARELSDRFRNAQDTSNLVSTSYGEGLYLCGLGAALSLVGALMVYAVNSAERSRQIPPE